MCSMPETFPTSGRTILRDLRLRWRPHASGGVQASVLGASILFGSDELRATVFDGGSSVF